MPHYKAPSLVELDGVMAFVQLSNGPRAIVDAVDADHDDDECPETLTQVCRACHAIAVEVDDESFPTSAWELIAWPCATVQALTQGGEE